MEPTNQLYIFMKLGGAIFTQAQSDWLEEICECQFSSLLTGSHLDLDLDFN